MKLNVLAIALAATALGTFGAAAQTVIEEHRDPGVTIEHRDRPAVTIERRDPAVVRKRTTVETNGLGDCASKTVRKEGPMGSKTVKKTDC